jgi:hypothetical protein
MKMSDTQATQILDELIGTLESRRTATAATSGGDAIDKTLAGKPRSTQVRSLRSAPEVAAFREQMIDGLIRADTANAFLKLVGELVQLLR